ncbi:metal-dependent transcriptional regulator [Patulibacter minatonensis]|uniref:metal-dependent transcriptional regulator n=1 Tax=Patulibacter minatonensis TaxID=298163 RepID=UPI00047901E5|nr:metal-dependent transcriptional regulator [Patulibacter minatonensis]
MASASAPPPSTAVEDYLKAVFALETRLEGAVPTTALAGRLGITPGSVSAMLRRLADLGLLEHEPYRGVVLTEQGRKVALRTVRNHRLLELFLVEVLEVPWDRVHDEAERLEHAVSDDLVERISAKLGHPEFDPHGDPIPDRQLEIAERSTRSLEDLEVGDEAPFVRVSDTDPAMLRYLAERGIVPGVHLTLVDRQPFGGPLTVRLGETEHALGPELAAAMRVAA